MHSTKSRIGLYANCDLVPGELHRVGPGIAAVFSARGPQKPGPNEDAALVVPVNDKRGVLAVADGFGGQAAGDKASRLALESLAECLENPPPEGELREAVLNGFEKANEAVTGLGVGAATTLAVVEISPGAVRSYHAGDSMILVVGQRGRIKLQTVSHSPVGYAVEAGLLEEHEAMRHEARHLVSNMVGASDMRIEVGPIVPIGLHDTVILTTDGVSDNLSVEEITEAVRKGPIEDVIRRIAVLCSRRMRQPADDQPSKPDDFTFIAFRPALKPSRRKRSAREAS